MDSIFDLHVHTREGSIDSDLDPEMLITEIRRLGLTGVVLAEHDGWQRHRFNAWAKEYDLVLIHALEVYTDMGHIITFGLDGYRQGMRDIKQLRKIVNSEGGYMILAHPFRFYFGPHGRVSRNVLFGDPKALPASAAEAAEHPVFEFVDAIEVVNGANMDEEENRFAQDVVAHLGRTGTGGSDAHSFHGLARGSTLFHGDIRNEHDLVEALRAGACTPLEGFHKGRKTFYGEPPPATVPPATNPA
ncbi:MAG: hypothetical protein NTZ05_10905 [Chloroflexi bacterium]|nr:hypothetical protein [Chloroflexota bacterium]